MLGIRLGILKFSELAIFILNQEINYPVQPPPAPPNVWKGPLRKKWPFLYPFSHLQRLYPPRECCVSPDQGPKALRVVTAFDMGQHPGDAASKNRRVERQFARELWATPSAQRLHGVETASRIRPREPSTSRWQWNAGSDERRDFRRRGSGHPPFRHRRWWPGRASAWCSPGAATWPAWPPADPCASGP